MHHSKMPSVHQGQSKFIIAFWYHPWKLLDQVFRDADYLYPKASWHWLENVFLLFHLHCFSIWRLAFWLDHLHLPVSSITQMHRIPVLCQMRYSICRLRSASSMSVITTHSAEVYPRIQGTESVLTSLNLLHKIAYSLILVLHHHRRAQRDKAGYSALYL